MSNMTSDWQLYEAGRQYLGKLDPPYWDMIEANNDFYNDKQWRNISFDGDKPVFNIIKRAISFFVASLTSNDVSVQLSSLPLAIPVAANGMDAISITQAELDNILERWNAPVRCREALTKAANNGDCAAHVYFDTDREPYGGMLQTAKGEIQIELVPGSAVIFGNANNPDPDVQPWIIVTGRDMVASLQDEAKRHRGSDGAVEKDSDFADEEQQVEIDADDGGKARYILVYRKDKTTGTYTVSKSTRTCQIFRDVDTGLKVAPIRWLRWEAQEGQYHGKALTTGLLPNQIVINQLMASVIFAIKMGAFPSMIYNADYIDEPSNEIGMAIPVRNMPLGTNLSTAAAYLEPTQMSGFVLSVLDRIVALTKECIGLQDAAVGNVNPEQASGTAIVATAKQAIVPLENIRAALYEWVEGIARVVVEMMGVNYGMREIVVHKDGEESIITFDFSQMAGLWMRVRADVGASSYWSEIIQQQTLDNLLSGSRIEFIDYLERIPDTSFPRKQELIDQLRSAAMAQPKTTGARATGGDGADYEAMAAFVDGLSPELQAKLEQLRQADPNQYETVVRDLMNQSPQGAA